MVLYSVSPEPSSALQDSWPHTSLDLIMQQQDFRMEDTFPEAQQVLKAILQQGYKPGHPGQPAQPGPE